MPSPPLLLLAAAAVLVAACAEPPPVADDPAAPDLVADALEPDTVDVQGIGRARAQIEPVGDGEAQGTITLGRVAGGTRVRAQLDGLSSREYHALQILRGRDCDADPDVHLSADASAPHGGPYSPPRFRHVGDLGSVRGDDGVGRYDRIAADLDLSGTASPVGRAVVVRALRDDTVSPGGAAGDVIGCGVFEASR